MWTPSLSQRLRRWHGSPLAVRESCIVWPWRSKRGANDVRVEREWELACAQAEDLEPGSAPSTVAERVFATARIGGFGG